MWRKGNTFPVLVGMQTGAATVENSMEALQKIKNGTDLWPSDPTSGNISEGTHNTNSKEHKHPYVHCNIIYSHQDMEAAQVPINRWVNKITMGYLYKGILLSYKKEKVLHFGTVWMDLENIMLSEMSQLNTSAIWLHSYVEFNEQTKLTSKTETDS